MLCLKLNLGFIIFAKTAFEKEIMKGYFSVTTFLSEIVLENVLQKHIKNLINRCFSQKH